MFKFMHSLLFLPTSVIESENQAGSLVYLFPDLKILFPRTENEVLESHLVIK